ncbi:MAG: hypothetical protein Q9190_003937 [Brigantiaea leucoxantha]
MDAQQTFAKSWDDYGVYQSGPYSFFGCTEKQGTTLEATFSLIHDSLTQQIIPDAQLGTSSRHGYSTFFKFNPKEKIIDVYQNMTIGHPVPTMTDSNETMTWAAPEFVCLNPEHEQAKLGLWVCRQKPFAMFTKTGTNLFLFCPRFWKIRDKIASPGGCPNFIAHWWGKEYGANKQIDATRFFQVMEALAFQYVPNRAEGGGRVSIGEAAGLDTLKQFNTPRNYAFYATSMLRLTPFRESVMSLAFADKEPIQ